MTTHIHFETARFKPTLSEGAQVNDGAYGFELALFLAEALSVSFPMVSYPLAEDWGWFLDVRTAENVEIRVGCVAVGEAAAGGGATKWEVFVNATTPLLQRLRRRPIDEAVRAVAANVECALVGVGVVVSRH